MSRWFNSGRGNRQLVHEWMSKKDIGSGVYGCNVDWHRDSVHTSVQERMFISQVGARTDVCSAIWFRNRRLERTLVQRWLFRACVGSGAII